jgi:hypothetical protein
MNHEDKQMILIAACCIIIILVMFVGRQCQAAEPVEKGISRITRAEAIRHLVEPKVKYKYRLPYYSKRIKAYKDEVYRTELVIAFERAAETFDLPVNLLIAIGYRETVFRENEVGPSGELGIMQVMPWVTKRRRGREHCSNVQTTEGGIMCGSWWLARARDRCGSVEAAVNAYVSGKCHPTHPRAREAASNRLWLWRYLDKLTEMKVVVK